MLEKKHEKPKLLPEEVKEKIALSVDEELFWAAANLVQAEEHLLQTLHETPEEHRVSLFISELISTIRSHRVKIMKEIGASNPKGEVWCALKHIMSTAYRLMEASEKAITQLGNPQKAKLYSKMARNMLELFLIGGRELLNILGEKQKKEGDHKYGEESEENLSP